MGKSPAGSSLDRIDNSIGYTPENCRWSSQKQQMNNTRQNRYIEIDGIEKTVAEWCDELGLNRSTVRHRLSRGWTDKESLFGKS